MNPQARSGNFLDYFPGTAGLLMVISAFFVLEIIALMKAPDLDGEPPGIVMFGREGSVVLQELGHLQAQRVADGQWWRIISCIFLHGGLLHFGVNMYVFFGIGRTCEPLLGTARYVTTFLLCGIGGSLVSFGWRYYWSDATPSVGASGAIVGLIGLLLSFSIRHKDRTLRNSILQWIVIMAISSFFLGHMLDHAGHIGGLVTGFALGFFVPRYSSSQVTRRWIIPCYVTCAVTVVGLGFALWNHFKDIQ